MIINNDAATQAFFELVRLGIGTSNNDYDFSNLSNEDWENIMQESRHQSVVLLCFDALKNITLKPPKQIYDRWLKMALASISTREKLIKEHSKLEKLLFSRDIPYIVLKGFSSACYYPEKEKRDFGDIDILVNTEDTEKARQLLTDNGYQMARDLSEVHYKFTKSGCRFELHKKIAGLPEGKIGECFVDAMKTAVCEGVREKDLEFEKPSDLHHGIIILLHSIHHMLSNGMGIRHLCDWACFVKSTESKAFWKAEFIPLMKKTGTFKFACGLTMVAEQYLGISRPDWRVDVPQELCDTIMEEIFSSGNFGRKADNQRSLLMSAKNSKRLTVWGKITTMIKALNKTNHIVCPAIKKLPILYPFVMVYRVFRYLVLMLLGKKPSLLYVSRAADERNKVYMKYELYKREEE